MKHIFLKKLLTDDEMKQREGTFFDETEMSMIIDEDADVYGHDDNGDKKLLFKFRKNVISKELCKLGFDNYKYLSIASRNRGASAGPIETEGTYWSKRELADTKKWRTRYMNGDKKSTMIVNNPVLSVSYGYYEKTPNHNLPCRMTHYTKQNITKMNAGMPFIERIDELYKHLLPDKHLDQYTRAKQKEHLQINDTAFSTITMNRNFRTALHKDAGDYGFGNLTCLEHGKYHGAYTCFPQYAVGFDLRQGDFVVMDVHQFHSNTAMFETEEDKLYNETIEDIYKRDNPKTGIIGKGHKYARLSFVCYLREKMIHCPDSIATDSESSDVSAEM